MDQKDNPNLGLTNTIGNIYIINAKTCNIVDQRG